MCNTKPITGKISDLNDMIEIIKAKISLGDSSINSAKFEKAINYYKKTIDLCEKALEICSFHNELITEQFLEKQNFFSTKIVEMNNKTFSCYCFIANQYFDKEEWEKAITSYQESLNYNDSDFSTYLRLAYCFKNLKQYLKALEFFEKVLVLNKNYFDCFRETADLYAFYIKDDKKAIEYYEAYLNYNSENTSVLSMLGHLYHKHGKIIRSFEYLKKSVDLKPDSKIAVSDLIYTSHKVPGFSQEDIFNLAKTYTKKYLESISFSDSEIYSYDTIEKLKNKKLKIGYISGNFYNHVVMYYILPIIKNHNKNDFSIYCYSNTTINDNITEKIKSLSDSFHNITHLSDKETAKLIYNDQIDILIDLDGHTSGNRIFVLAYKPAPIQITYVGCPNTTGLETVDYFLTNNYLSNQTEQKFFREKLYFLDSKYRCYENISKAILPELIEPPVTKNGYITFGSFNDLSKINEEVIKLWSDVLKKINNSKLYICRTTIIEEFIYEQFSKYGIGQDRLILDKKFSLAKYNDIDISLDTFPYSGVTVVFDSLIMGVPLVTLYGETFQGKEAANINFSLGLNDLIAHNHNEYIEICIKLSENKETLKKYKYSLREKLFNSEFYQYSEFTKSLENSYKKMWNEFCEK